MNQLPKSELTVAQLGDSLAVRIPRRVAKSTGLHKGDRVSIRVTAKSEIVIERYDKPETLEALCAQINSGNKHEEVDLGPAVGREEW